jgi:hypothetical protein
MIMEQPQRHDPRSQKPTELSHTVTCTTHQSPCLHTKLSTVRNRNYVFFLSFFPNHLPVNELYEKNLYSKICAVVLVAGS